MKKVFLFAIAVAMTLSGSMMTSCESCSRKMHSLHSNFSGGLQRKVTLLDYEGDTLKVWEGKFDVQFTDRNSAYWDLNGKRVMISGGIIVNEEE